jgi:O-antigen/teichoic acid export membrane protein
MDQTSLTFLAFKNTSYNILGFLWPIIFTLLVTPLIVFKLGVKEYGIYLFVTATLTLLGLLDLGLGTAVTKHLSYYYGKKDNVALRKVAHSSNSLFLIIGTAGFALVALIALGSRHFLPAKFDAYQQYSTLFLIGGAIFFVSSLSSTCNSILTAVQRFDISTKINMAQVTVSSLSMLLVVELSGSLEYVFLTQLAVMILLAITLFYQAKKALPVATLRLGWDKKEIASCFKFGIVNFINNIASTALSSLDRLIIPFFAGPSNLTYYSIPGNVGAKIPGLSNTLSVSLFPTVSQLSGGEEISRIKILYIRSFRLITIIAGALTVTVIAFSYQVLRFWLNQDFAVHSSSILVVLALTNFILALFGPLSNFLLGLGKLKFLSLSSIGMAVFNALLLLILLPLYGIAGAAYAYLISVLPVAYFFYYVEKHYLNLPGRKRHYLKTLVGIITVSVIVWLCDFLLGRFIVNLATLLSVGGVSALLYVILYKLLGFFEQEDWQDLENFYSILLKKIIPTAHAD